MEKNLSKKTCPYCDMIFKKIPGNESTCPNCSNLIYVVYDRNIRDRICVTKERAKELSEARDRLNAIVKEEKLNKLITGIREAKDNGSSKSAYFALALYYFNEKQDFFEYLVQSKKFELLSIMELSHLGINEIKISCPGGCESCLDYYSKRFSIEEAIKAMPIPNPNCTHNKEDRLHGWCRCWYEPIFDLDKIGAALQKLDS
jgi:hypothetical protein